MYNVFYFILQTKLHDTTCKKRQLATIATHDMKAINSPLKYEARMPSVMKVSNERGKNKLVGAWDIFKLDFLHASLKIFAKFFRLWE